MTRVYKQLRFGANAIIIGAPMTDEKKMALMLNQYRHIKARLPDALVLFRLDDFTKRSMPMRSGRLRTRTLRI